MNTVLIVEDEKMIRQGIKTMIQRSGVEVDTILECNNGERALDILEKAKIDVMFTDIRMPKMDGIQLVKEMQKFSHKPLTVVVSGYDDFSYAVEMLRLGVREYILKPIEREQIKKILEKLDSELSKNKELQTKEQSIGHQQLKYLVLNEQITVQEKDILIEKYHKELYENNYVVCCLNNTGGEMYEDENCIYLSDVEGVELYLTKEEKLGALTQDEFMNRYVGVSNGYQGLENLKKAYAEARCAKKEGFFIGNRIVYYRDIENKEKKEGGLFIKDSQMAQLSHMLGTDKWEEAIRQLECIFHNAKLGAYPFEEVEENIIFFMNQILSTYQNVIRQQKLDIQQLYQLDSYNSFEEWQAEFMGWITQLGNTLNCQYDDYKNKQKIQQAIHYIQENYSKDLNMAVVSNYISMNYSLFSYVFKQYTGKNFVNYIKDIRMEEAKRLLKETDMKIIDISEAIGYENVKHFMKIFKNICGVSPTEYRKNLLFHGETPQ